MQQVISSLLDDFLLHVCPVAKTNEKRRNKLVTFRFLRPWSEKHFVRFPLNSMPSITLVTLPHHYHRSAVSHKYFHRLQTPRLPLLLSCILYPYCLYPTPPLPKQTLPTPPLPTPPLPTSHLVAPNYAALPSDTPAFLHRLPHSVSSHYVFTYSVTLLRLY